MFAINSGKQNLFKRKTNIFESRDAVKVFLPGGKNQSTQRASGKLPLPLSESFLKFPNCGLPWVAKSCHPVYHPSGLPQVFVRPRFIGTMGVTHSQHALIKPHVLEKTWIRCQALEVSQDGIVSISKPRVLIQLVSYISYHPHPPKKKVPPRIT